jgi:hypothetical protein
MGKWTPDEDKMLQIAENTVASVWRLFSFVPVEQKSSARTDGTMPDPSVERATGRMDTWTIDEDNKPKNAGANGEENWSAIAALPWSNDNRWHTPWIPKSTARRHGTGQPDHRRRQQAEAGCESTVQN